MARFYTDEDIPSRLVQLLYDSDQHHDVITTRNVNKQGDSDADQLLTATQQRRILLTHNEDDFLLLHLAWHRWSRHWGVNPPPSHTGIVAVPQQRSYPFQNMVNELDWLVSSGQPLANELYRWHRNLNGWTWERWDIDGKHWGSQPVV